MTGYGRGECARDGIKITVELSSVNRKQSEIVVNLPRDLEPLESRVRDEVNRRIARGRLTVRVTLHAGELNGGGRVQVNIGLAKAYAKELQKLAAELKISDGVSLDLLLRAPGVVKNEADVLDSEVFWPVIRKALTGALAEMIGMRETEGTHLKDDLRKRVKTMTGSIDRVERAAPQMVKRYRDLLRERIQKAGLELPPAADERLAKEVVYFADRSDISEEITRLRSHFKQFEGCAKSKEPVGRTLDFLAQEIHREINTIGSKAMDSRISNEVVKLKAEVEKFREQVQNVE